MSGESLKESGLDFRTITTTYEDYVEKGGKLDPESFEMLETFQGLDESSINEGSFRASRYQAYSMESFTGVELTGTEVDMYVLLRTLPIDKSLGLGDKVLSEVNVYVLLGLLIDKSHATSGKRPQRIGDKELLAEILRVTDPV